MKFAHATILTFLLFCSLQNNAQQSFINTNFSEVDKFARSVKPENDLAKLSKTLTTPYKSDVLKLRSLFIWVTENIAYDTKFVNENKMLPAYRWGGSVTKEMAFAAWQNDLVKTVIENRQSICTGYAYLFKRLCDFANLRCDVVSGYTKRFQHEVGIPLGVNHDWNVVQLNGSYYFVDATWAAGTCNINKEDGKLSNFTKHYNNYYWLMPFSTLVKNHYPSDPKWLLDTTYTKEKFFNAPFYEHNALSNLTLLTPTTGVLHVKIGDTIHFAINYAEPLKYIQLNSNIYTNPTLSFNGSGNSLQIYTRDTFVLKQERFMLVKTSGNLHEFNYVVTNPSIYYLDILVDFRKQMRFKVLVEE